jgi:HK97 family phage major capsid protein
MTIGDQPVFVLPQAGIQNAPGGFLLGRPVIFSEHCKTLGDKGDLQLVDLGGGYYSTTKAGGTKFDTSIHLYFDYGVEAFRWTVRAGGQPFLSAAISPANGSSTKSHFVVLDARA